MVKKKTKKKAIQDALKRFFLSRRKWIALGIFILAILAFFFLSKLCFEYDEDLPLWLYTSDSCYDKPFLSIAFSIVAVLPMFLAFALVGQTPLYDWFSSASPLGQDILRWPLIIFSLVIVYILPTFGIVALWDKIKSWRGKKGFWKRIGIGIGKAIGSLLVLLLVALLLWRIFTIDPSPSPVATFEQGVAINVSELLPQEIYHQQCTGSPDCYDSVSIRRWTGSSFYPIQFFQRLFGSKWVPVNQHVPACTGCEDGNVKGFPCLACDICGCLKIRQNELIWSQIEVAWHCEEGNSSLQVANNQVEPGIYSLTVEYWEHDKCSWIENNPVRDRRSDKLEYVVEIR